MIHLIIDLIVLALLIFVLVRYLPRLIHIGDTFVEAADHVKVGLKENNKLEQLSFMTKQLETYLQLLSQLEKIERACSTGNKAKNSGDC